MGGWVPSSFLQKFWGPELGQHFSYQTISLALFIYFFGLGGFFFF